jgi:uncharacterized membrane protein
LDTKKRAWVKSIVWRIIGIVLLGAIAYFVTGNWEETNIIMIVFHGIRVIMYFYHERAWERISWGKIEHPLSDIGVTKKFTNEEIKEIEEKLRKMGHM